MRSEVVYVVLVDGRSTRVIPEERKNVEGPSALARVGKLVQDHMVTTVAEHAAHAVAQSALPLANVLLFANPLVGMAASVALASRSIAPDKTIGVIPESHPGMRRETLDRCEREFAASGQQAGYPTAGGQAGYPVYLSPEGRARLEHMPSGELLDVVRGDEALSQIAIECHDVGIYKDLGTTEPDRRLPTEDRVVERGSIAD